MNQIKKLRLQKNMTQTDLGKVLGKTRQYIHIIENGIRPVPKKAAEELALFFGVSTDVILEEQSFKKVEYFTTTLENIIHYFKKKGINYKDYKESEYDTEIFYYDSVLHPLLTNLIFPQRLGIDDLQVIKEVSEVLKESNRPEILFSGENKMNNANDKIHENYNKKIDQVIEKLRKLKFSNDGDK